MYVDDILAVSPTATTAVDMARVDTAITGLLGPNAIARTKDEVGRRLDFIGWQVDLDAQSVTLSERNLYKTIFAFFSFDVRGKVSRKQVETMASLASRCSQLCRPMRPYTKALYDMINTFPDRHVRRTLSALAKVDIAVWRAFLLLSHFDAEHLSRPITSFAVREVSVLFGYDASLSELAVGVYIREHHTATPLLIAFTALPLPFPLTSEAKKQNTFEYGAVVLGLLVCHILGLRHRSCELHGDSISSLTWSLRDRADSILARRTNIGCTIAAAHIDMTFTSTVHVPGKVNVIWDGMSRGKSAGVVGLPPALQIHFPPSHPAVGFIRDCCPDDPLIGYSAHASLSQCFAEHLRNPLMCLPHPIHPPLYRQFAARAATVNGSPPTGK
jgi:hypothetical protein